MKLPTDVRSSPRRCPLHATSHRKGCTYNVNQGLPCAPRVGAHMGPYMGPCGPIWAHMDLYGPIWAHVGPYGSSWTGLGRLRKLSVRLLDQFRTFRVTNLLSFIIVLKRISARNLKNTLNYQKHSFGPETWEISPKVLRKVYVSLRKVYGIFLGPISAHKGPYMGP